MPVLTTKAEKAFNKHYSKRKPSEYFPEIKGSPEVRKLNEGYKKVIQAAKEEAVRLMKDKKVTRLSEGAHLEAFVEGKAREYLEAFNQEKAAVEAALKAGGLTDNQVKEKMQAYEEQVKQEAKELRDVHIAASQRMEAERLSENFRIDIHQKDKYGAVINSGTHGNLDGAMEKGETRLYYIKANRFARGVGKLMGDKGRFDSYAVSISFDGKGFTVEMSQTSLSGFSNKGTVLDPAMREAACDALIHAAMQGGSKDSTFTMKKGMADDVIMTMEKLMTAGFPGKLKVDIAEFKKDTHLWPAQMISGEREKVHRRLDALEKRINEHNTLVDGKKLDATAQDEPIVVRHSPT